MCPTSSGTILCVWWLIVYCTCCHVNNYAVVVSAVAITTDQLQCYEEISDGDLEVTDDDIDVEKGVPAAGADNGTGDLPDDKADELVDDEPLEEGELEDGETDSEDDSGSKTYGRDFLLSLQFLEQCKQRPANLMNAEYIRKVYLL